MVPHGGGVKSAPYRLHLSIPCEICYVLNDESAECHQGAGVHASQASWRSGAQSTEVPGACGPQTPGARRYIYEVKNSLF